jgi:secreted PhoX family phosphatase
VKSRRAFFTPETGAGRIPGRKPLKEETMRKALGICGIGVTAAALGAVSVNAQPFTAIDTNFTTTQHIVPASPLKSAILFRGYVDTATNKDGAKTLSKDWNDFTGYVPIYGRNDSGYVIVNNEVNVRDSLLGDGGGMTVFTVAYKDSMWKVVDDAKGKYRAVDFSEVGGTIANCGGGQTPWGTVLTAEEWEQPSYAAIDAGGSGFSVPADYTITEFNGAAETTVVRWFRNGYWMVGVGVADAEAW